MTRSTRFVTDVDTTTDYVVGAHARLDPVLLSALAERPIAVVVDRAVARVHAGAVDGLLSGLLCLGCLSVDGGEAFKTPAHLLQVLDFLETCELPKHGVVLSIGGGTISDVTGLAAMLVRRSVGLVLLPTTLLSQVDAAIGGKNGINSESTKNLFGHFYHPLVVACDPVFLSTLPLKQVVSGIAECTKVFAVTDGDLLDRYSAAWRVDPRAVLAPECDAIHDAAMRKLRLLAEDPYERSSRRLLNYGHAFAHLFEERSGYRLLHGEAVLMGMMIENEISRELSIAGPAMDDLQKLIAELLTPTCRQFWVAFGAISGELARLRRMRRGALNLVCLREPGIATIVDDAPEIVVEAAWNRVERYLVSDAAPVLSAPARPREGSPA